MNSNMLSIHPFRFIIHMSNLYLSINFTQASNIYTSHVDRLHKNVKKQNAFFH